MIFEWFTINNFIPNVKITYFLQGNNLLTLHIVPNLDPIMKLTDTVQGFVDSAIFQGSIIDSKRQWKNYINYLVKKLSSTKFKH